MGIDVSIAQVDPALLGRALQDPRLFPYYMGGRQWLSDITADGETQDLIEPAPEWALAAVQDSDRLHFDRAWYILETVLSGADAGGPPPFCNLVWGGKYVEAPYLESCQFLTVREVADLGRALEGVSEAEVASRFDARSPPGGGEYHSEAFRLSRQQDAAGALRFLRPFYMSAAARGRAIVKHTW